MTANVITVVMPKLHEITMVIWSGVGNSLVLTKILSRNFLNDGVKKKKSLLPKKFEITEMLPDSPSEQRLLGVTCVVSM